MEAAKASDIVFTMLSDETAVEQTVLGPQGILNGLPTEGIHISASTTSMEMAHKLTEAHEARGQYFVSATVLGRPDAAKAAKLRILLGLKDVELALSAAQSVSAPLPLGELIRDHYREGITHGYGHLDWAAFIQCLELQKME